MRVLNFVGWTPTNSPKIEELVVSPGARAADTRKDLVKMVVQ